MKNKNNQLLFNTIISESLNTRGITGQQRAQTKASVSLNIPLCSTHVTTTVSKSAVCYITDHTELFKKPESTPTKLTKSATNEISTVWGDDQNHNISSF